jgi:hypothetical protein
MAQQWRFEQDEQAQWRWVHMDGKNETVTSNCTFPNQLRCMMDAMRFVVQRRRASPTVADADSSGQAH